MIPCISQVVTLTTPFEEDIPALSRGGWRGVELWLTKLETFLSGRPVSEARKLLDQEGLTAQAASFQGGLLLSEGAARVAHWDHFRRRLAFLNELGVPLLVVAPDFVAEPTREDLGRACVSLAEAAELAREAGVRLVLEFQRGARFCASLDSALALIGSARGADVSICFDAFHYYTGPSKLEDLELLAPGQLGLVQVCDLSGVPRELATDADRILPGDGDFRLGPLLDRFAELGYAGAVSLELQNPLMWEMPAERVAGIALAALERTLGDRLSAGTERGGEA